MSFTPANFVANLVYLVQGMVGLFIALGLISLTMILLNKISTKKEK